MADRRKLSTLKSKLTGAGVTLTRHTERNDLAIKVNGKLVATISPDDLFDQDGNRFEDDI